MPIYEYRCKKCGKLIEKIQKVSDRPLSKHEDCGGKLEPVLSSPAIQFKGSGFYITDYARKNSPSESTSAKSSEGSSKSSDGGSKSGDSGSKTTASESKKTPAAAAKKD